VNVDFLMNGIVVVSGFWEKTNFLVRQLDRQLSFLKKRHLALLCFNFAILNLPKKYAKISLAFLNGKFRFPMRTKYSLVFGFMVNNP
jgi:hypothetical protein